MATSILQSVRGRRNGALHSIETSIEEQVESLRDEIAALAKTIGKTSAGEGSKLRYKAEASLEDLMGRSDDLLKELQDSYLRGAREMRDTVRRHPVATIGAAAALGVLFALIARR
ncbi:DUF883 family protein [Rhizobium sp. RAF56]|jgi:ElaB/YqjD/DUF883 family membrane-anchored ribosome-binding protein|uniref:DUF883 family protein n=1 Tax=Rhizobium sp. RAF56 TaxID=3233062 RepID=UPI003F9BC2FC